VSSSKSDWHQRIFEPSRARAGERRAAFTTSWGENIEALYTHEDADPARYLEALGFPGMLPFTRGVYPTMYRGRLWTMRQYSGYATADETNARFRYLLEHGQTGLSTAFDLPTQLGYDPDHALSEGEVGKVGVSIATVQDMDDLMHGIPLDKVSVSMTINATASILLAFYVAVAKRRGVSLRRLAGTVQNDILKEYAARGNYIYPPAGSMRLTADIFRYCRDTLPYWNPISISGYHMREAGCHAVQEVAFTMANAVAYCEAAFAAGLTMDEFAPRLSFFFASHMRFLEEIAKFRAARRIWARIAIERLGARDPDSARLRFHAQTAGSTLTAQQPVNNVARVAIEALAAVLGGAQSVHCNAMDEAWALPTDASAQLALRTQQVIAYESGVADSVDPVAGSFAVEALTDRIEKRASELLAEVDRLGGALAAIGTGFVQRQIEESAYREQQAIERGEQVVVGVNEYRDDEPPVTGLLRVDPTVRDRQIARLRAWQAQRSAAETEKALSEVRRAAEGDKHLMPLIVDAVEAGATLGEICDALRAVWGEQK